MKTIKLLHTEVRTLVSEMVKYMILDTPKLQKYDILLIVDEESSKEFVNEIVDELVSYSLGVTIFTPLDLVFNSDKVRVCHSKEELEVKDFQKEDHRFPKRNREYDVLVDFTNSEKKEYKEQLGSILNKEGIKFEF